LADRNTSEVSSGWVAAVPARSLRRNFSAALTGNVVYAASQFGMLVALAQLTSPAEVGRYALALAVTSPIFIFAGLKLRQVQVTDAAGLNAPQEFFGLRLVTSTAALFVVALVGMLCSFPSATVWTLLAVGLAKALEAQIDVYYGAMQRREQLQLIARSQVIRGIAGFAVFGGTLALWGRVELAAASIALVTGVQVATNAYRVRSLGVSPRPRLRLSAMFQLARLALPLGVAMVLASLIVNVPRYVLESQLGGGKLGIFAVLAYSLVASGTVASALVEAAMPRLSNLYVARDLAGFKLTLWRLMAMGAVLGLTGVLAALLLGEPALDLVFGPQYGREGGVLLLLTAAATLQYTAVFLGTAVNAMRLFTVQMPINLASLVVVFLVSWFTVPAMGLAGAGLAVLAAEAVQSLCYVLVLMRAVLPRLAGI
jgi:O-antigen/teichoic acid export membrane protein